MALTLAVLLPLSAPSEFETYIFAAGVGFYFFVTVPTMFFGWLYWLWRSRGRNGNGRRESAAHLDVIMRSTQAELKRQEELIARLLAEVGSKTRALTASDIESQEYRDLIGRMASGTDLLSRQLDALGVTPVWHCPTVPVDKMNEDRKRASLFRRMIKAFSMDDINQMCFELNVNCANIPGNTLNEKVRGLIEQMTREDRMSEVIRYVREQRPNINW